MRHCVPCVDGQIQDHAFDLGSIGLYSSSRLRRENLQLDILSNYALQHLGHFLNNHVQVEEAWLKDLLLAKSQKLLRQGGCSLPGSLNFVDSLSIRVLWAYSLLQFLAVADDYAKKI